MYREANAWESSFFAPHDTKGLIGLYKSNEAFEKQLDSLFSIPWNTNYIAENINCFIGQYCHGNQPDHGFPYLYYFVDKQEKSQALLNTIMDRFYGMEESGLALCGMDDCGEMSSWYVFNAIGIYPYSPADEDYIVTVPLFDKTELTLNDKTLTILKKGTGNKIGSIVDNNQKTQGYFVAHHELIKGGKLVITTQLIMNTKLRSTLTALSIISLTAALTGCHTPGTSSSAKTPCMDVLDQFTAANVPAMGPDETESPAGRWTNGITPPNLPGNGLAQHPMLCVGENYDKMFLVKDGKVIWTYSTGKKL